MTDRQNSDDVAPRQTKVGYRKPPASGRFKKGQSGNPRGRPPGRHRKIPYDAVLGQKVQIKLDGRPCTVTAAEAFLLNLMKTGLAGDASASELALGALEAARRARHGGEEDQIQIIIRSFVSADHPGADLVTLGMAVKLDRFRPTIRLRLHPWLVETALTRLEERRLTSAEQRTIWDATRTPHKVKWPDWWTERRGWGGPLSVSPPRRNLDL